MLLHHAQHALNNSDAYFVIRLIPLALNKMQHVSAERLLLYRNDVDSPITRFRRKFDLETVIAEHSGNKFLKLSRCQ